MREESLDYSVRKKERIGSKEYQEDKKSPVFGLRLGIRSTLLGLTNKSLTS